MSSSLLMSCCETPVCPKAPVYEANLAEISETALITDASMALTEHSRHPESCLAAPLPLHHSGEQISLVVRESALWQDGAAPDIPQAAQLCHQVQQSPQGQDTRWDWLLEPLLYPASRRWGRICIDKTLPVVCRCWSLHLGTVQWSCLETSRKDCNPL